ncbi:MAG: AAA family ATPase [Motiliproteus sp.]
MLHKSDVMLVGRSRDALSGVVGLLENQPLLSLRTHVFGNGRSEIWRGDAQDPKPHALALCVDEDWRSCLPGLLQGLPDTPPPFLVLCPTSDIELLRAAMRAGARDVLSPPYEVEDLTSQLQALASEGHASAHRESARLVAFINAKGGSGASFLAASVASAVATRKVRKPLLVDFDLQFGSLPIYLNMSAGNGLIKALEFVDTLDSEALQGYVQVHDNGLHLLAAAMDSLILPDEIADERIKKLLNILDTAYNEIIVDLPRRIDRHTAAILERQDQVVVVTQQSVTHLRDTQRLMKILHDHLGITAERVLIVLNRFNKQAEVRADDFANVFPGIAIETVPGDYARVSESINLGIPVVDGAPRSPLGKSLRALSNRVLPQQESLQKPASGLFGWLRLPAKN